MTPRPPTAASSAASPSISARLTRPEPLCARPAYVSELLGISLSQVYSLAQSGDLPGAVRIGASLRFHIPTVTAWVEQLATGEVGR